MVTNMSSPGEEIISPTSKRRFNVSQMMSSLRNNFTNLMAINEDLKKYIEEEVVLD